MIFKYTEIIIPNFTNFDTESDSCKIDCDTESRYFGAVL